MLIDNVLKGFPKDRRKEFKDAVDDLIKAGVLRIKKTKYGDAVYIDPKQRIKIKDLLEKYYDFL